MDLNFELILTVIFLLQRFSGCSINLWSSRQKGLIEFVGLTGAGAGSGSGVCAHLLLSPFRFHPRQWCQP